MRTLDNIMKMEKSKITYIFFKRYPVEDFFSTCFHFWRKTSVKKYQLQLSRWTKNCLQAKQAVTHSFFVQETLQFYYHSPLMMPFDVFWHNQPPTQCVFSENHLSSLSCLLFKVNRFLLGICGSKELWSQGFQPNWQKMPIWNFAPVLDNFEAYKSLKIQSSKSYTRKKTR